MAVTNIWVFGSMAPIEVSNRGVIDNAAQDAFTRGQCHALAIAIHERTGWQLAGLVCPHSGDTPDSPGHVVVMTPDGDTLDIGGRGALARWQSRWGETELCPINETDAMSLKHYMKPDVDVARPFVPNVLKLGGFKTPRKRNFKAAVQLAFGWGA